MEINLYECLPTFLDYSICDQFDSHLLDWKLSMTHHYFRQIFKKSKKLFSLFNKLFFFLFIIHMVLAQLEQ